MLDATHGPDPGAAFEIPPPTGPWLAEVERDPAPLRIAYTTIPCVDTEVHPDCIDAVADAAALLESLGHEVVEDHVPIDGAEFARNFLTVVAGELGADIGEASLAVGRRPRRGELEPSTWALGLISSALSAQQYAASLRRMEVMARDVGEFFEQYDIVLTPTISVPPPPLGTVGPSPAERTQLKILGMFGSGRLIKAAGLIDQAAKSALDFIPWTPVYNITGHPAMSMPLYWSEEGLPIGVHFVGRFAREDTLFRLAGQLERARPWFDRLSPMARTI
jgi:amidase